ncbi:MAG: hypothetical protein KA399_01845 [Chitinophagaceae bacterium]|nr:hypothetical protein [Chitinophagaceae bacterium]
MLSIKTWIKRNFSEWIYYRNKTPDRKSEMENWLNELCRRQISKLSDSSYNNFTYHGEDGILLYLLRQIKDVPNIFVDIGSGDCIKSNCANLAVHYGWDGVFIDKNDKQIDIGKRFYHTMIIRGRNIRFLEQMIIPENVNNLLENAGMGGEIGLLSIDVDGNDYWIWEAIKVIKPRIVVIEAKVEFGTRNVIVPYGDHNHYSVDKMYNGASVEAIRRLGLAKGYKLIGANKQGYNLFFVKIEENIKPASTEDVLSDTETIKSFYPEFFFTEHKFSIVNN